MQSHYFISFHALLHKKVTSECKQLFCAIIYTIILVLKIWSQWLLHLVQLPTCPEPLSGEWFPYFQDLKMLNKNMEKNDCPSAYRIRFRRSSGSDKALQAFRPLRNMYSLTIFHLCWYCFPQTTHKLPFSPYHHHYHHILWKSSECQEWAEKSVKVGRHFCKEGGGWGERLG